MVYYLFPFLLILNGAVCLRDVVLRAPEAVRAGDSLPLACHYTLEREDLYSLKFYQGDTELYRFMPRERPPTKVFPLQGVTVDTSRSNDTAVTLRDAHRAMTGYYKCEVSGDTPRFHTLVRSALVTVTEDPRAPPEVRAERPRYALGETIRATCSSPGGHPAANLTWYINDLKVRDSQLTRVSPPVSQDEDEDEESAVTVSVLEVVAAPQLFLLGAVRMRCEAAQFSLYQRSAHLTLWQAPAPAPTFEPTSTLQEDSAVPGLRRPVLPLALVILHTAMCWL